MIGKWFLVVTENENGHEKSDSKPAFCECLISRFGFMIFLRVSLFYSLNILFVWPYFLTNWTCSSGKFCFCMYSVPVHVLQDLLIIDYFLFRFNL